MTTIVAQPLHFETQTQMISEELCALLRQVDPSAWRDGTEVEAERHADRITGRLRTLVSEGQPPHGVRERLGGLLEAMERAKPASKSSPKEAWHAFLREVQPAYEALATTLRTTTVAPPTVRPTNYTRSLFHVASGVFAAALIKFLPSRGWLLAVAAAFMLSGWTMEIMRRQSDATNDRLMRLFGKVAHPHERYRVNSSTWYCTALFLLAAFAPLAAAEIAVLVLGVADPIAALVGRRFGKTKLVAGRSLEGSLAFFGAAALIAFGTLALFHPLPLGAMVLLTVAAAGVGALAELFSTRLDDNFTIPTSVAAAVGVAAALGSVAI